MTTQHNRNGRVSLPITLTALFALALAFTLSCSNSGGGSDDGGGGGNNNGGGASCGKLMSQNLNVNVDGSVCYGNDPANCIKYGRLYDWATAMNLPAKCNRTLSTSDPDCAIQNKHKGICPSGQHIPSKEELEEYGSYGCLKNQAGGLGSSGGDFDDVGNGGYWWSSQEYNSNSAYNRGMYYCYEDAGYNDYAKSRLFSVRCVKD
ncbi:MAG: hypothetical protein LBH25_14160 [Fibromonadaceae bacterium]|jgi:hypothetical protein|nr:hypothetical protein [Fibromonadaceae bacterium]